MHSKIKAIAKSTAVSAIAARIMSATRLSLSTFKNLPAASAAVVFDTVSFVEFD